MHLDRSRARELASDLCEKVKHLPIDIGGDAKCLVGVCPPSVLIPEVVDAVGNTPLWVGGQNLYYEKEGAYTGEVTASMLTSVGCQMVIVGHSERRKYFGETDESVARKTTAAIEEKLLPIVCVGETLKEREQGHMEDVVARQVRGALSHLDLPSLVGPKITHLVLAYEPVWAIGTGKTAAPEDAEKVHALIRELLAQMSTPQVADSIAILYGGSVKPGNAESLTAMANIDGALVGGASLKGDDFSQIVRKVINNAQ